LDYEARIVGASEADVELFDLAAFAFHPIHACSAHSTAAHVKQKKAIRLVSANRRLRRSMPARAAAESVGRGRFLGIGVDEVAGIAKWMRGSTFPSASTSTCSQRAAESVLVGRWGRRPWCARRLERDRRSRDGQATRRDHPRNESLRPDGDRRYRRDDRGTSAATA
jgi:hypothetical protein